MNIIMAIHIAGGILALPAGTIAVMARKGGRLHVWAGNVFFASMLVLGVTAALMAWSVVMDGATTPAGPGVIYALALVCLTAGLLDLNAILRKMLTPAQRIARHLWRMCFAFFIATGSFFLGQQDVLPLAVRGSPFLFVLAFAPFAVMAFWLVRVRFAKVIAKFRLRAVPAVQPGA